MSDLKDFVIENGVLKKYKGKDEEVIIPNGVKKVASEAFFKLSNLKRVVFNSSLIYVSVERRAFASCASLESVEFYCQVSFHLDKIIANCNNLQQIVLEKETYVSGDFVGISKKHEFVIPIIAHNVALSSVDEDVKMSLAMGYCLAPEKYPKKLIKGYEGYIQKNILILIETAERYNYKKVIDALKERTNSETNISDCQDIGRMSLKEAEEIFWFHKKDSGYKIDGYRGTDKTVTIPRMIGETLVTLISSGIFSGEHIIKCRGKLFSRLDTPTKIRTYVAYINNEEVFSSDQIAFMEEYMNKSAFDMILKAIKENDDCSAIWLIKNRRFTREQYDQLIDLASNTEVRLMLIEHKGNDVNVLDSELELEIDKNPSTIAEYKQIFKCALKDGMVCIRGMKNKGLRRETVVIPGEIEGYPVAIDEGAFEDDDILKSITLLEGVTKIGNYAFKRCPQLSEISFPLSLKTIGIKLFEGCRTLWNESQIVIINGVLVRAFVPNDKTELFIPEGVEVVKGWFLSGADNVRTIYLPESAKHIERAAFYVFDSKLEHVYFPPAVQTIEKNIFEYISTEVTIHAPAGSCAERYAKRYNIPFVAE